MRGIFLLVLAFFALGGACYGGGGLNVTNEVIYEKLLEIERRLVEVERRQAVLEAEFREFKDQVNRRFEELRADMNARFEQMQAEMNARFEETGKRIEQLYTFLWIVTGIFSALVAVVIGFALWDERTKYLLRC